MFQLSIADSQLRQNNCRVSTQSTSEESGTVSNQQATEVPLCSSAMNQSAYTSHSVSAEKG